MLGVDVTGQHTVVIVDASDHILGDYFAQPGAGQSQGAIRERLIRLTDLIESRMRNNNQVLCAYMGNGEIAIIGTFSKHDPMSDNSVTNIPPVAATSRFQDHAAAMSNSVTEILATVNRHSATGGTVHAAVGRSYEGVNGLACSYQDARFALSLVPSSDKEGRVHSLASLALSTFLGSAENTIKAKLATLILAPIAAEPYLIETLTAFFGEECCYSRSARQLVIHRNTLSYRLDRISDLTGLNPRKHSEAVQLGMALHFHSMSNAPDLESM